MDPVRGGQRERGAGFASGSTSKSACESAGGAAAAEDQGRRLGTKDDPRCELKRYLKVVLEGTTVEGTKTGHGVADLLLVIEGVPFDGVRAREESQNSNTLIFFLEPEINKPEWKGLLAGRARTETFAIALAVKDQGTIAAAAPVLKIVSTARASRPSSSGPGTQAVSTCFLACSSWRCSYSARRAPVAR